MAQTHDEPGSTPSPPHCQRGRQPEDRVLGVMPVVQPSGANQSAVTLGNTDGAIGGLTIGATYSQAEVQALRALRRASR